MNERRPFSFIRMLFPKSTHLQTHDYFLINKSEIHTEKKAASLKNGAGQGGWMHIEQCK